MIPLMCAMLLGADPVQADVVVRGATLFDGSIQPGRKGDLAIRGDRIVALGSFTVAGSPRIIDGTDLYAAPGFIDLHTHSDEALTRPATRSNFCFLSQGVTTAVTGNCGFGPTDVAAYFRNLESNGVGSNVVHLVPHNTVRRQVLGNADRPPTPAELKQMQDLVEQGMRDGAWGMSTGLIYNPGIYARTDELTALAGVAGRHGGIYASHIRDEGPGVLTAVEEALTIGRTAKVPVHISHLKVSGRKAWDKMPDVIARIAQARDAGQVVSADQYPYPAGSTTLAPMVVPAQFRTGTAKDFQTRLEDAEQAKLIRAGIARRLADLDDGKALRIARYAPKPAWQGKDLAALAEQEKKNIVDLVLEIERAGGAAVVVFSMSEPNVRLTMKQPFVATASDGTAQVPSEDQPHPRSYGCFPRKIGRYAIDEKLMSVEQAVRSASGLPADILHLPRRGYLRVDHFADVVVFDPKTFRDQATFEKPHQYSTGVRYLFVNGKLVIDDGKEQKVLAGKPLRHKSEK